MSKYILLFSIILYIPNSVYAAASTDCSIIQVIEDYTIEVLRNKNLPFPKNGMIMGKRAEREFFYKKKTFKKVYYTVYFNSGIVIVSTGKNGSGDILTTSAGIPKSIFAKGTCIENTVNSAEKRMGTAQIKRLDLLRADIAALAERVASVQTQQANLLLINLNMIANRMARENVESNYDGELKTLRKMICLMAPNIKDSSCK